MVIDTHRDRGADLVRPCDLCEQPGPWLMDDGRRFCPNHFLTEVIRPMEAEQQQPEEKMRKEIP